MNPFFHVIYGTIAALARTCPKCGHRQIAAASRRREAVACKRCNTPIPPPGRDARPS